MKKIHMYAGLLSFTAFCVWGIAGIRATILPAPQYRQRPEPAIRDVGFQAPGNLSDREMADRMIEALDLPFTRVGRRFQRDENNHLTMTYFTPNGRRRLILLEQQNKIRIEALPSSIWQFLDSLHIATFRHSQPGWPLKAWGVYNEFSIWALLFMTVSGVYLWLASRPQLRWATYCFAGGSGAVILFYVLVR